MNTSMRGGGSPRPSPSPRPDDWNPKDAAVFGLIFSVPVGLIALAPWLIWIGGDIVSAIVLIPALTVTVFVTISGIVHLAKRSTGVMAVVRSTAFISVVWVVGWSAAVAAGVTLVAFGVDVIRDSDVCEPSATVRCGLYRNGEYVGESNASAESQRFSNFMIAMIPMVPGLLILAACAFACVATVIRLARRLASHDSGPGRWSPPTR